MKDRLSKFAHDGLRVTLWTVALTTIASLLMFHVWNQYRITQIGYRIAEVTAEHRQLLERNKKLSIEAAVVGRSERLATLAKERFGLEPVAPGQIRVLSLEPDEHAALVTE